MTSSRAYPTPQERGKGVQVAWRVTIDRARVMAKATLHRRLVEGRESKCSASKLVLVEELSDCSLVRKLLDAREHRVPRHPEAEHVQRQVVLYVRLIKSFQSVGGAAPLDEAREAMLLVRDVAAEQQVVDLVVVAEAVLGRQTQKEAPNSLSASSSDERLWIATDQQLGDLGVVLELERQPQGGLAIGVLDAQNAGSRQGSDTRNGRLVREQRRELLLPGFVSEQLRELVVFGARCAVGAAMVSAAR